MNLEVWRRRPACWVAFLLSAGVLLAEVVRLAVQILIGGSAVALLLALFWSRQKSGVTVVLWCCALLSLGLTSATLRRADIAQELLTPRGRGERVILEGTIESEPIGRKARVDVEVLTSSVTIDTTNQVLSRRVLVQIPRQKDSLGSDSLEVGDVVRIAGTLETLPGARNPGEFDYGRFLALNGIRGFVVADESGGARVLGRGGNETFSNLVGKSRKAIYKVFDQFNGKEQSSFLKGVVFGYRGDLSAEVKESFMLTGTIHILAVSGSNVAVVTLVFFSVIGFLRVPHRVLTALTLLGLLWYMVITGLSPSVIRATIMAGVILLATVLGRRGDIYNSLAVAALLMLLWDPLYIYDVGFQLSFSAVLSIVIFYPKLDRLIESIKWEFLRHWRVLPVLKLGAVSIAAQIGTLPFSVFYFGRISLIAVLANLVVVPLSGLNTLLGLATLAFSYLSTTLAACYAALNDLLVSILLRFVLWSSQLPLASLEASGYGLFAASLYYTCVFALFFVNNPRVVVRLSLLTLFALDLRLYSHILEPDMMQMRATVLDVGQGDAILLEFPHGKRMLVDAGPRNAAFDAGARTIGPWLRQRGINALDALLITHPHDDHFGGGLALMDRFRVNSLIVPDTVDVPRGLRQMLDHAYAAGVQVIIAREGDSLLFDPLTRIFVLNPPAKALSDDPNDRSIVLKMLFGQSSLLLAGDASKVAEVRMVRMGKDLLKSDVLKIGHHGSSTSSSNLFLESVRPSLAVISVGRVNRFKHPSRMTIARLLQKQITTQRTDFDGAVVLESRGVSFTRIPWRKLGFR